MFEVVHHFFSNLNSLLATEEVLHISMRYWWQFKIVLVSISIATKFSAFFDDAKWAYHTYALLERWVVVHSMDLGEGQR